MCAPPQVLLVLIDESCVVLASHKYDGSLQRWDAMMVQKLPNVNKLWFKCNQISKGWLKCHQIPDWWSKCQTDSINLGGAYWLFLKIYSQFATFFKLIANSPHSQNFQTIRLFLQIDSQFASFSKCPANSPLSSNVLLLKCLVAFDTWHLTFDTQGMVNFVWKFQLPSSIGLEVMMFWRLGGKGWLTHCLTELISNKDVCRAVPDNPGLLITLRCVNTYRLNEFFRPP